MGLIELVRGYCCAIRDGRTLDDVWVHLQGEQMELLDEMVLDSRGEPPGEDGIVGEAMDVILCALDLIYLHRPDLNIRELHEIATAKCEKWRRKAAEAGATVVM